MKYIQVDMDAKSFSQSESVGKLGYDMIRGNAASLNERWSDIFNQNV